MVQNQRKFWFTRSVSADEKATRSGRDVEIEIVEEWILSCVCELHSAYTDTVFLLIFSSFFYWLRSFLCHFYLILLCKLRWLYGDIVLSSVILLYKPLLLVWFVSRPRASQRVWWPSRWMHQRLHVVIFWCTTSPLKEPV